MTTPGTDLAVPTDMRASVEYAKTLADSSLLPKAFARQPANVLWAVEYGRTLGVTPMAALTGIHVIEGKPSASAALISGLIRRAGHRLRVTGDDRSATAQIIRSDDPDYTFTATWTIDRAKAASLTGKAVWKSYPAAMLKARAITEVARDACEEILFGLHYTPEELGASVSGPTGDFVVGEVIPEAAPVPPPPARTTQVARDWKAEALNVETVDEARELWRQCQAAGALDLNTRAMLEDRVAELAEEEMAKATEAAVDTETGELPLDGAEAAGEGR